LGKAVVSVFLNNGASALSTYTVRDQLAKSLGVKEEYGERLLYGKADVTKSKDMSKVVDMAIKKFGRIDFLINIVGGFAMDKIIDTDETTWDRMMNMNLKSVFICSKAVIPQMIKQKYGRIINIGARPALKGSSNMSAYGASKASVLNLTQSMADELSDYNINVNAIIPGTMDTPRNRKDMPGADHAKWVKPEEIAEVISFLCSKDGDSISGATIPVYGKT
jgi:NAD(P)-dependent dehydrogenase (short-subunit alcohol dehydrogenase family)